MEASDGHYELPRAMIPRGWSNDPDDLGVDIYFANKSVNDCLNPNDYFSHPIPILTDNRSQYIFEEKGRGFFIWYEIHGAVAKIEESSLDEIIAKLKDGDLGPLKLSSLKTLGSPSGEPTSNVPYLPDPNYIDRPHLTTRLREPQRQLVVLYGPDGIGKSQLAIQYAQELRSESPTTWVFWVCATTAQKFRDDLAVIADILPEGSTSDNGVKRMDQVLQWLCADHNEPWLMVVDDASVQTDVWSVLMKLLSSGSGRIFVTTAADPEVLEHADYLEDINIRNSLEAVPPMTESEALQLLHKKLENPARARLQIVRPDELTPLAIQLLATCVNLSLLPCVDVNTQPTLPVRPRPGFTFGLLYDNLIAKSPTAKTLLYFVSYFNPPEVDKLWLQSYLMWREQFNLDELELSRELLTTSSLLEKIPGGDAYRMHTAVQNLVVDKLRTEGSLDKWQKEIELFVNSRNSIPRQTPSGYARYSTPTFATAEGPSKAG